MRQHLYKTVALAGILAASLVSCGDVDLDTPDGADTEQRQDAVTVVPEFSISGTAELPEDLHLSALGLTISEIRLEPVGSDTVAYSTRSATQLRFDVENGETVKIGESVELPTDGRYLVSVRLEPIAETVKSEAGSSEQVSPSFSVAGYVAGDGILRVDPRYDDKRSDGSPVPMPFDEDGDDDEAESSDELRDSPALPTEWTPFHYDSRRSVFFTLNEVEFHPGSQVLSFDFDVHDWALELVDPLLSAIQHNDDLNSGPDSGIDVTSPLESTGHGAEALFENASVHTQTATR